MEAFSRWVESLAEVLKNFGLPEAQAATGALILIYAGATAAVLLIIVFLFRLARSRRQPPPSEREEGTAQVPEAEEEKVGPPTAAPAEVAEEIPAETPGTLFDRMRSGLARTQSSLVGRIDALLGTRQKVDRELLEELEEILITADFGMKTSQELIQAMEKRLAGATGFTPQALRETLKEEIRRHLRLDGGTPPLAGAAPLVIMVVGVNGVGKTTTIGKLAWQYGRQGKKVILGAGDTFRAAAAEQLAIWGERSGAEVVRHGEGSDPAAVAFDAVRAAVAREADVLILDTAGRLHTKVNLMEELKKVRRVLDREVRGAPHEVLLVLDATTGQNALVQARLFKEAVNVSGIALTKLDGTARGGIIVAIARELELPVRFIGIGERPEDLRPFDADIFVEALFQTSEAA